MNRLDRRLFLGKAGAAAAGIFNLRGLFAAVQANTSPYRRPRLKITDVRTAQVQNLHARVYTDQGLIGEGEAVDAIGGAASIITGFRAALLGQDPLNIEAIFERLRTSGIFLPLALAGAWRLGRGLGRTPGLWLLVGSAAAVCFVFFPQERFRIPVIDPALLVLAGTLAAALPARRPAAEARLAA